MAWADHSSAEQDIETALLIAAPASGSGKTVVTLGLLAALRRRGADLSSFKSGPDYIDPKFHEAAGGSPCHNLDAWAMSPAQLTTGFSAQAADWRIIEGAMGLFDGPECGSGSAADLAAILNVPVVLVVNAKAASQSLAATISGFCHHRADIRIAGVILNNIGSARHLAMIKSALTADLPPLLGAIPMSADLALPSRHLGLVQQAEHQNFEQFLQQAADIVEQHVDLDLLQHCCRHAPSHDVTASVGLAPLGQHVAVARDVAFQFAYPHLLESWQAAGASISFFSPLKDEAPDAHCDAVFLPGGYPELHAATLADASHFKAGLTEAAKQNKTIYGECGGYMVLGQGLVDANGQSFEMAGLLPISTSFEHPKRHLGYRQLTLSGGLPWGRTLRGHEFHYAREIDRADGISPLFQAADACGRDLGSVGVREGSASGSFMHVISERIG